GRRPGVQRRRGAGLHRRGRGSAEDRGDAGRGRRRLAGVGLPDAAFGVAARRAAGGGGGGGRVRARVPPAGGPLLPGVARHAGQVPHPHPLAAPMNRLWVMLKETPAGTSSPIEVWGMTPIRACAPTSMARTLPAWIRSGTPSCRPTDLLASKIDRSPAARAP